MIIASLEIQITINSKQNTTNKFK